MPYLFQARPEELEFAVHALCRLIESEEVPGVIAAAIGSLQRFGPSATPSAFTSPIGLIAVRALIGLIEGSRFGAKKAAIEALSHFGPDSASEAVTALTAALADPSAEVRLAACGSLEWMGGHAAEAEDGVDALVTRLGEGEDPEIRREAARALLKIDPGGKLIADAIEGEGPRRCLVSLLRSFTGSAAARGLRRELRAAWGDGAIAGQRVTGEGAITGTRDRSDDEGTVVPVDPLATEGTGSHTEAPTSIVVARYSDLGIGIHNSRFYLFERCPTAGQEVRLKDGRMLVLRGKTRWPKVLDEFARSEDGRMARKSDLI